MSIPTAPVMELAPIIYVPVAFGEAQAWVAALHIRHEVRADTRHFTSWPGPGPRPIQNTVLHSTQVGSTDGSSLHWLSTDPASIPAGSKGPSAHTLVGRDGTLWELVAPADIAHHVGWARPGYSNRTALGLEMENSSSTALRRAEPYPAAQRAAVAWRLAGWHFSYGLAPARLVAHREIAVWPPTDPRRGRLGRRSDPDGLALDPFRVAISAWLVLFHAAPAGSIPTLIR